MTCLHNSIASSGKVANLVDDIIWPRFCSICNKGEVGPTSKVLTAAGIRRVVVAILVAVIVSIAFEFSHIFLKVLTVTGIRRVGLHF